MADPKTVSFQRSIFNFVVLLALSLYLIILGSVTIVAMDSLQNNNNKPLTGTSASDEATAINLSWTNIAIGVALLLGIAWVYGMPLLRRSSSSSTGAGFSTSVGSVA